MGAGTKAAAVAGAAAIVFACWSPTQVTVSIVTDLTCPTKTPFHTGLFVGGDIDTAELEVETDRCAPPIPERPDADIGSVVLVPAGAKDGRVIVHVVMNTDGGPFEPCRKKIRDPKETLPDNCIVARRAFRYVRHKALPVVVRLDNACRGKACLEDETCINGRCQPSDVDDAAFDPGCRGCGGSSDAEAPRDGATDGLVDGGPVLPCTGPTGNGVFATEAAITSHLAVNDKAVFWAGAGNTVMRAPKDGSKPPAVVFEAPSPVTALAVDNQKIWIGAADGAYLVDLSVEPTNPRRWSSVAPVVAISAVGDVAFVSSDPFGGSEKQTSSIDPATSTVTSGANGGDSIAASTNNVFVAAKTGFVFRYHAKTLAASGPDLSVPAVRYVAMVGDDALLTVGGVDSSLQRVGPTSPTPGRLVSVNDPTQVAVKGNYAYVLEGTTNASRVAYVALPTAAGSAVTPLEGASVTYPSIRGLAVDECVYFFAQDPAAPSIVRLMVRPKPAGAP